MGGLFDRGDVMYFGKIVGTVVSTRKDKGLVGLTLFVVRQMDMEGGFTGAYVVASDSVGAGVGEVVLYATGSSARQTEDTRDRPNDAVIMAIVDTWEVGGRTIFQKNE